MRGTRRKDRYKRKNCVERSGYSVSVLYEYSERGCRVRSVCGHKKDGQSVKTDQQTLVEFKSWVLLEWKDNCFDEYEEKRGNRNEDNSN